jgi:diguanylate cyclase (GGDEF)-like protein
MTADEVETLGYPLCLGLWCGDHYQISLQLYAPPGRGGRWPVQVVRRLTTLAAVAAAGLRGLHAGRRARHEAPVEMTAAVRDATFLSAILPYALAQAHRHRETLTVLCVEADRLAELARSHGGEVVDRAVRRLAEAMSRTLRGSDVIARLDDNRVMAVLPNTGSADALMVATVVRTAVVNACLPVGKTPALTASMGVACFPDDATDSVALLSAADEAMSRARALGPNQVARFASRPPTAAGG